MLPKQARTAVYAAAMDSDPLDLVVQRIGGAKDGAEIKLTLGDVFVSEKDAARWWTAPHELLGGDAPQAAVGTAEGLQRVRQLLVAIRAGGAV